MGKVYEINIISPQERITMRDYIDNLAHNLRLTQYQSDMLKSNIDKYNMGRIVKRGGVVYVPYMAHGIFGRIAKIFCGVRADLIGQSKVLIKNKRNIKFCKNGYHYVKIGPYTYYADAYGQAISRDAFLRGIKN